MKKRILSLALCLVMCLSLMPMAVLAEGEDDDDYVVRGFDVTVTGYEYGATVGNTTAKVDTPGVTITELVWEIPNNKSGEDVKASTDTFDCRTNILHIFYTVDEPYMKGFGASDITINGSKPRQIFDNKTSDKKTYIRVFMPQLSSPCTEHTPSEWIQASSVLHTRECTVCRLTVESKSHSTYYAETVITPPTCTEEGVQAIVCSVCGYEKSSSRVAVPAVGHTMGEWSVVKKPTADEAGSRSRACTVCDYTETQELAAGSHVHELTYVAEVPATKFAAGIAEHYYCPECGGYFLDEAAEEQVTEIDLVIPQLPFEPVTDVAFSITGYEYGKPVSDAEVISQTPGLTVDRVEWSYRNTVGGSNEYGDSDTFGCHDNTVTVYYRIEYGYINNIFNGVYPGKAAVTDMGDLTTYWTSKDMTITLPALASPCGDDHTPGEWIRGNGHHDRFCTVCGYHIVSEDCTYERKEVKAPTCTEEGAYGQVCTVCGWEDTTAPDPIRALGHLYGESYKVEPTCTEDGYYAWDCTREGCGFVLKGSSQPKLGHKVVYQRSVPATCTEPGLTEGYYCSRCSEVLMAQETIPAKGHTSKSIPAVAATCTESGSYGGEKCADCGEILTEPKVIPAKGHAFGPWNYINDTQHQRVCQNDPSHVETGTHTNLGGVCDICGSSTEHIIVRGFDIAITGYEYGKPAGSTEAVAGTPGVTITDIVWNVPNNKGGSNAKAPTDTFDCRTNSVMLYYTFNEPYIDGFTIDDITVNGQKPSQIFDNKTYYLVYMPSLDSPCEEHTPGDWMQWNGFHRKECTVCREMLENVSCNATYVETVITPPTCTEEGVKANVCSVCGHENVTSRRNIPATGHTMGEWSIVEKPTAEEAGSQTRTCTVCGFVETQELAAGTHIHETTFVPEQAATKFMAGVKAHYLCTDCGKCFSDAEAKYLVTDADLYIPLIPFDTITDVALGITGYEYGKSISDATVVSNTPGISIVDVEWRYSNTVGGSTLYDDSAAFDCHDNTVAVYFHLEDGYYNNIFNRDDRGYVDAGDLGSLLTYVSYGMHNTLTMHMLYIYLPALTSPCGDNHTPGEWIRGNGHHDRFCTVCGYHIVSDKCTKERTVIKPSTCAEDGYYGQVCTVCGWVDTSTPDPIARQGHVLSAATVVAPTCTEQGYTVRNCTREGCDYAEKSAFTEALGHTVVTDPGTAATCTTAGLTDGSHCSVCGEVLAAQETIPMLGHKYGAWTYVSDAQHQRVCENDPNHVETADHTFTGDICGTCGGVRLIGAMTAALSADGKQVVVTVKNTDVSQYSQYSLLVAFYSESGQCIGVKAAIPNTAGIAYVSITKEVASYASCKVFALRRDSSAPLGIPNKL